MKGRDILLKEGDYILQSGSRIYGVQIVHLGGGGRGRWVEGRIFDIVEMANREMILD